MVCLQMMPMDLHGIQKMVCSSSIMFMKDKDTYTMATTML